MEKPRLGFHGGVCTVHIWMAGIDTDLAFASGHFWEGGKEGKKGKEEQSLRRIFDILHITESPSESGMGLRKG